MRNISLKSVYNTVFNLLCCMVVLFSLSTITSVSFASGKPKVAAGWIHNTALKSDGSVWAWGNNDKGQLGDETKTDRKKRKKINKLTDVTDIACGWRHTVNLKSDGTVWSWGDNTNGQLGDGTTTNSNTPVQVNVLSNVTAIACGGFYTVALRSDGTVWAWGENINGQLGGMGQIKIKSPLFFLRKIMVNGKS